MGINVISYEFERLSVSPIVWEPVRENLADPGNKADSPVTNRIQLLTTETRLTPDFPTADMCDAGLFLG